MKLLLILFTVLFSSIHGQLVLPGRTTVYRDPGVRYRELPPSVDRETVLQVVPITRPQVVTSRNQVTNLQVVPIARPQPVVPRVPVAQPPLYSYDEPAGQSTPYAFKYSADHGEGATSSREESSDGNGAVRGSYSYQDSDGLYRQVDYIADESGYRASVRTNEPGTERSGKMADPAGTTWEIAPPPEAVVARYANVNGLDGRRGYSGRRRVAGGRRLYSSQPVGGQVYGSRPVVRGGVGSVYGAQPVGGSVYGAQPVTGGDSVYRSEEPLYGPPVARRTNYNQY